MNIIIPKIPEKTIVLPSKKDIVKGIVTVLLSRASLGGACPLGLAFAATMGIDFAYIPLIALTLGAIFGTTFTLKYICGYFIFRLLVYLRKKDDENVKAVALGFSLLFTGAVELLFTHGTLINIVYLCAEAFIVGLAYLLFIHIEEKNSAGAVALLVAIGSVFNGFMSTTISHININLGVFCSMFTAICLCYAFNLPIAVFGSCILGFLVNINSGTAVEMTGLYALSAVMGALLSDMGKFGVCTGFLCGVTVCFLEKGAFLSQGFLDIAAALALFALLPEVVHYRIFETLNGVLEQENAHDISNKKISQQLKNIATAVQNLADGITEFPEKKKDKSALLPVFNSVAARACRGCSLEGNCWKKDRRKTYSNMYELWNVIETEGYCDHTNIPLGFKQVCMRSESFLSEFNHAYELYKQSCMHQGDVANDRDIVARQYGEISNVINVLSHQVEVGREEDEPVSLRYKPVVTYRQEPKNGQAVCGDTLIHFEKHGKYFVILCDGMGYGESALSESRLTARLFAEFLRAGFQKETAVSMINSTLALKADKESFSTVDLLEIDLQTGVARFLKIGSAQSFIKTKGKIEEISSKALPVGILENIEVKTEERELKNNDVILMVSDGIGEAGEGVMKNEWIKKMMMLGNRNDSDILHLIIEGAKTRGRVSDDMTGVIIRLKKIRGETI